MSDDVVDLSKLTDDELKACIEARATARAWEQDQAEKARRRKELEERAQLAELESRHGALGRDIAAVFSPLDGRMVVVRRPKPITFEAFQTKMIRNQIGPKDFSDFVQANLVYPSPAELERIVDTCPDVMSSAAGVCAELGGAGRVEVAGK